jgi:anaphase-promoting complex subunit 3
MHSLREMLRLEPHRVRGLEILSTALWHLKRDTDLASLAQQSVEVDRLCPEVWCVVGNCFSLQREHSTAVRFFERALQLAPDFVYAHTLCGHEHFANESYDKAIASFRQALRCDERHFNAW